ncbi:hypothetical protein BGW38_006972 [Lunasporangiospora selenospora]|uniref:Uncharacterized protein n=1 Tax=Lunasporangiospora selenospora TaxID=979761 RepID=A0A9P6KAE4_9FUNG|nr:hypothetical protein BGW38_006972 [Lunasporangiospora selenospora]
MAMTAPAPMSATAGKNNCIVPSQPDSYSNHPQPQPQHLAQRRLLKSSKSVEVLGRARSYTADPTVHSLRGNFQNLQVNSPNLTKAQMDAYGSNAGDANLAGSGTSQAHGAPAPVRHDSGQYQMDQSKDGSNRMPPRHTQSSHNTNQQLSPYDQPSSSSLLQVQSSHTASRSTPKLTLYPQSALQSSYTNESKETRSFNGLPGQLEPKSKPKSSNLKPIVPVENNNEDHVERDQYGFKKETQWLSHNDFVIFETYYIPIMERRRQKWAIFMNDSQGELPPRSAKLKRYIRKGIPPALRGEVGFETETL